MPPDLQRLVNPRTYRTAAAVVVLCGLALLLVAPLYANLYWLRILSMAMMFATLAQGINLIAGFAGYPAFGNVVFFGCGAYTTAIVMVKLGGPFWLGIVLAALVSLAIVLIIGPALLRLRGHYFAIATVGLNEMVKALVANLTPLTGGGMGLSIPLPPWDPSQTARVFYYLLLATMLVGVAVTLWFRRSRLGLACRAIRDDEVKAEAMGLRTTAIKTAAWAISAMLTGVVGAIYAYWFSYVEPPAVFDMLIAVKSFVIFLLGGAATVLGPVLGAFFVEYVSTTLWSHLLDYHLGALGIGVMLIALYMPNGFVAFLRSRAHTLGAFFAPQAQHSR